MNDGLLNKLARVLRRPSDDLLVVLPMDGYLPPAKADAPQTTDRTAKETRQRGGITMFGPAKDNRDRRTGYEEYRLIDAQIPEAGMALDSIASSTTSGEPGNPRSGFEVEFSDDLPEEHRQIVTSLYERIGAYGREPYKLVRASNKIGDVFSQPIVDRDGNILRLKHLRPEMTTKQLDSYERHVGWVYDGFEGDGAKLMPWEVLHLAHAPELGETYGRSLFASGGRDLRFMLTGVREGMAYRTLNAAAGRNVFIMSRPLTMSDEEREVWLDQQYETIGRQRVIDAAGKLTRRALEALADQDVILDYAVDVDGKGSQPETGKLAEPNLAQFVEVSEHFQDLMVVLCKVPRSYMGLQRKGDGLNSGRANSDDVHFARICNAEQHDVVWYYLQLARLQFALLGLRLPAGAVRLIMPDLLALDVKLRAEVQKLTQEAAKIATDTGLPFPYVWVEVLFAGERQKAEEAAARYRVDLTAQPQPVALPSADEAHAVNVQRLEADVRRVIEGLDLVVGARGENDDATPALVGR